MSEPTLDTEAFRHFERITHDRIADSYQTFFEPVTNTPLPHCSIRCTLGPHGTPRCGHGTRGRRCQGSGTRGVVTGVDLAPRMMALAAQRYPQLVFHVADVETLPFWVSSPDALWTGALGVWRALRAPFSVRPQRCNSVFGLCSIGWYAPMPAEMTLHCPWLARLLRGVNREVIVGNQHVRR